KVLQPVPHHRAMESCMSGPIAALFKRLTQGVYVVGVVHGEVRNAFTAAWVMQVSFDPLLLALSINPRHSSYGLLKAGRAFRVNVLKKDQLDLAEHYGQPASRQGWDRVDDRPPRSTLAEGGTGLVRVRVHERTLRRRPCAGAGKSCARNVFV